MFSSEILQTFFSSYDKNNNNEITFFIRGSVVSVVLCSFPICLIKEWFFHSEIFLTTLFILRGFCIPENNFFSNSVIFQFSPHIYIFSLSAESIGTNSCSKYIVYRENEDIKYMYISKKFFWG